MRIITICLLGLLLGLIACNIRKSEITESPSTSTATDALSTAQSDRSISVSDLKRKLDGGEELMIIDVRTDEEVKAGKIHREALHINILEPEFEDRLNRLEKNQSYYLYCNSGGRSGRAQRLMTELGFTRVINVEGGLSAWVESGYSLED